MVENHHTTMPSASLIRFGMKQGWRFYQFFITIFVFVFIFIVSICSLHHVHYVYSYSFVSFEKRSPWVFPINMVLALDNPTLKLIAVIFKRNALVIISLYYTGWSLFRSFHVKPPTHILLSCWCFFFLSFEACITHFLVEEFISGRL